MKISKYTFLFQGSQNDFYVYSSLSNALLEIDESSYLTLKQMQKELSEITSSNLDAELYEILADKKFIVDNDLDSLLYYKSVITTQRSNKSHMHLTVAPTMDCCFDCHYCFEKYKGKNYMSEEVMDSIVKYLNSFEHKPDFKLTWFGGEPLMALPQMERFYDKLLTHYKKPGNSNVITTGFHINPEAIRILKKIGVAQVQITLDGLKETHNQIKFTEGCDDAFTKVLDNVELLLSTSDIHVVFRVNLTKLNAQEYVELYRTLSERYKQYKNLGISPAFVMDRGGCNTQPDANRNFFTGKERSEFILDLYRNHQIHSPFIRYPSQGFNECAIRNVMSISFDPEGFAYKCWEVIGNKEYAIGRVDDNGRLYAINEIILNRQLYGADILEDQICKSCKYLPICHGGCPIQRIENTFEHKRNQNCTYYKGHMKDFLQIHLSLKKAGITNK